MRWIVFGLLWLAVVAPGSAAEDPAMREPDAGGVSAERKYRDAITLDPSLPEPWNGLGYALRQQRRLEESERAYREALRLRPDYPLALEYLGHAYVEMGRLDDACAVLARLRPLDPREADELAEAIARAARR
jgi:Flp pilus assembly protein TadD